MKVASKTMLTAIAQHKERRRREQRKAEPAGELAPIESEPETYDDYTSSWQNDYANAVGISRHKEL